MSSHRHLLSALVLVLAASSSLAAAPVSRPIMPRGALLTDEQATVEVFRKASPSVVYITTLDRVVNLWTRNVKEVPKGTGSGFVWDEQGHIVTNYHVIAGGQGGPGTALGSTRFPGGTGWGEPGE